MSLTWSMMPCSFVMMTRLSKQKNCERLSGLLLSQVLCAASGSWVGFVAVLLMWCYWPTVHLLHDPTLRITGHHHRHYNTQVLQHSPFGVVGGQSVADSAVARSWHGLQWPPYQHIRQNSQQKGETASQDRMI